MCKQFERSEHDACTKCEPVSGFYMVGKWVHDKRRAGDVVCSKYSLIYYYSVLA